MADGQATPVWILSKYSDSLARVPIVQHVDTDVEGRAKRLDDDHH
jgi:hypothetical protein